MRFVNTHLKRCSRPLQSVPEDGTQQSSLMLLTAPITATQENLMMSERDYFCMNPFFVENPAEYAFTKSKCPSSETSTEHVLGLCSVLFIYTGGLFGVAAVRLHAASSAGEGNTH